jgi:putative phosphoribosyl transferase
METRFRDRSDAGRRLGERLSSLRDEDVLILGLARGGVVVAAEVARALRATLDVVVVRKVGAPHNPEFGIGAVGPGGARAFDADVVARLGLSADDLDRLAAPEEAELRRRLTAYRDGRPAPEVAGRTAILVDDGLATGVTASAAATYLRQLAPRRLILAVPVGSPSAVARMEAEVDEVVCLAAPDDFYAVGPCYEDFRQTTDEEVTPLLQSSRGGYLG